LRLPAGRQVAHLYVQFPIHDNPDAVLKIKSRIILVMSMHSLRSVQATEASIRKTLFVPFQKGFGTDPSCPGVTILIIELSFRTLNISVVFSMINP